MSGAAQNRAKERGEFGIDNSGRLHSLPCPTSNVVQEKMTLRQKRFLRPTFEFTLGEEGIIVKTKRPFSSTEYEISYRDIRSSVSLHRHFPILALIFASVLSVAAIWIAVWTARMPSEDLVFALLFPLVITAAPSLICWWVFLKTKVDFYIIHDRYSGHHIIYIDRWLPTQRHASEFVEMLKERVAEKVL
jgi:hypothetical protein